MDPIRAPDTFLFGHLRKARTNMLDFLNAAGPIAPVVELDLKFARTFLVSHPDGVKHVLFSEQKNYSRFTKPFSPYFLTLGRTLFTSEGDDYKTIKKAAAAAFHQEHIEAFRPLVQIQTKNWLESHFTEQNRPFIAKNNSHTKTINVSHEMGVLILKILMDYIYGRVVDSVELEKLKNEIDVLTDRMHSQGFLYALSGCPWSGLLQAGNIKILKSAQRRLSGLKAKNDLSDKEAFSLLLIGSETTALVLPWMIYLSAKYADITNRLDLKNRKVVTGFMNETLRLYPPAWKIGRTAIKEDEICGYQIPKNALVILSPWVTHRHPDFWTAPNDFNPLRFSQTQQMHPYQFFPFGAGPRVCIGRTLAEMMAVEIFQEIHSNLQMKLVDDHQPKLTTSTTLKPQKPIYVIATKSSTSQ